MHKQNIVHRDLKPENVMVVPLGASLHAKLFDFGLASRNDASIVLPVAQGTPAYCAPEQLRGEMSLPASDIYAWALMFLECLSASPFIQGATVEQLVEQQLSAAAIALPEKRLGRALTHLLQRALHKDVHLRSANAASMHEELMQCIAQLRINRPQLKGQSPQTVGGNLSGHATQLTMDPVGHTHKLHQESVPPILMVCLMIRLCTTQNSAITLPGLQEMREQQMQWCKNQVQAEHGVWMGTLGDCMLFVFDSVPDNLQHLQ